MNAILEKFLAVRNHSCELCKPLQIEDYIPQAIVYASPPKWHLAHTTWFFEEMILKHFLKGYQVFNPEFSFLFNSYYNTIGARTKREDRGSITRPGVEEVYAYRKFVDEAMTRLLTGNISEELLNLVTIGLNHEQQHQELLITDLKYTLSLNPISPVYRADFNLVGDKNIASSNAWIDVPEGLYEIGFSGEGFCFDNELGCHKVFLPSFQISNHLITNGEYLEFMKAGGYKNFRFWLDEGWAWVCDNEISSPLYWKKVDGQWFYYTLSGLKPIDKEAILCHISFYEAAAFAAWRGCRLPTEFEWEIAAQNFDWGKRWEWTYSAYLPYPGFKIAEGALGEYNGKFMVSQMVLRGASVVTPLAHSRATYRNFFHPHFQWQFSGIRLAK
ncbi:MAG: ergothioneine biosynthesis protein EgtB [Chitinophagaceae bacterium]